MIIGYLYVDIPMLYNPIVNSMFRAREDWT